VGGKPLVIADGPPEGRLPPHWRALSVDDAEGIEAAKRLLATTPGLRGLHLYSEAGGLWDVFRSAYLPVRAAGGLVTDERGRLLAIRRLGVWDLPKGKVEKGEGIEAAALREVVEECGLRTLELLGPLAETWHTYERGGKDHLKRTDWFLMRGSSKEALVPQTVEGIEEVRWMDADGISALKAGTYPSLLPVIAAWEALPPR